MNIMHSNLQTQNKIRELRYDRSRLTAGIVHIGLGNFHRAHQAWYLHKLMEQGLAHDFAILGAGVRAYDEDMRKKLASQDYITTLIELSPEGISAEAVGSMIGYIPIEESNQALIAQMAQPNIRIVSTTVTEGGYYIDPATKGFDREHSDIIHDGAHPDTPKTAFGAMVAALKIRRDKGLPAFTCQSCDNVQGNGDIMRQTVVSLAALSDPELAKWIDENSSFPNSMVDSIVPATGEKELSLAKGMGIDEAAPVTHENFRQWVIEDDFCNGRPEWEKVGVTLTPHVHDYEIMKIRILNGGHQLIAAPADLLGVETISGAMEHALIGAFFAKVEREEIMPHVAPVPEYTPEEYVSLIDKRFRNPVIVDTTRRVAFDGFSRQPGFILPSVLECLQKDMPPNGLALSSALWARYCLGVREDGSIIEANDPYWSALQERAKKAKSEPRIWLENKLIYGALSENITFAALFTKWLLMIYAEGVEATLQNYLKG